MTADTRPTPEQFAAALELSEREGIGLERALLAQQANQILPVQQAQWLQANMPAITEYIRSFAAAFTDMMRTLRESDAWPLLAQLAEVQVKEQHRRERHARWQARNYRRR